MGTASHWGDALGRAIVASRFANGMSSNTYNNTSNECEKS
jgi:hypothetical protein